MSTPNQRKKIIVATDFSESSLGALSHARGLLENDGADVTVLTAVEAATHGLRIQTDEVHGKIEAEAKAELQRIVSEIFGSHTLVSTRVIAGSPADAICEEAERINADLVIVGSHGAKGLRRYLIGSVAEKTVRHAPCSVLVVR